MNIRHYLDILKYPRRTIFRSLGWRVRRSLKMWWLRVLDKRRMTYLSSFQPQGLAQFFSVTSELTDVLEKYREIIMAVAGEYQAHYFDLLGSGWVNIRHGMKCHGVHGYKYDNAKASNTAGSVLHSVNKSNQQEAKRIANLLDKDYVPIDWQLDFKTGYRWQEAVWYSDSTFGEIPGTDIKVPWELGRMQHLPMLAWAFALAKKGKDFALAKSLCREFQNQVLDFIAYNPPRYGVNWSSTMDVAIRMVSWLVTFDLFRSFGAVFDAVFLEVLERSIYEHSRHCFDNLEWSVTARNNHYLSNVAGLFIAAAYLPEGKEVNQWFTFSAQELVREMAHQFNGEGTNFETSTTYHGLATQMLLYSAIYSLVLEGSRRAIFPEWFWERLERALEFILHLRKPSGDIPQFGDNDSGRFLKLWPYYNKRTYAEAVALYGNLAESSEQPDKAYWDENSLNYDCLLAVGGLVFSRQDMGVGVKTPEVALVKSLLGGRCIPSYHSKEITASNRGRTFSSMQQEAALENLTHYLSQAVGKSAEYHFSAEGKKPVSQMESFAYPAFGLYIYQSPVVYLAVRCGGIGRGGRCGHAHNDQLALELTINARDIVRDPGTYLYTPLPAQRNLFRSTGAHFTPQVRNEEQNSWEEGLAGLFSLNYRSHAECLVFTKEGFAGAYYGFTRPVYRIIRLTPRGVVIHDFGGEQLPLPGQPFFSPGYGRICKGGSIDEQSISCMGLA